MLKHQRPIILLVFLLIPAACWILMNAASCKEPDTLDYLELFSQVVELVQSTYLEETDPGILALGAVEGMLLNVSHYCSVNLRDTGSPLIPPYGPIDAGLVLGYREPFIRIIDVIPGSIAEQAGLIPGDALLRIDDQVTPFLTVDRASRLLSGEPGKKINLVIQRHETGQFEEINLNLIAYPDLPDIQIGWKSNPFYMHIQGEITPETLRKTNDILARTDLRSGLILDLRHLNSGDEQLGLKLADIFIPDGVPAAYLTKAENKSQLPVLTGDGQSLQGFPMAVILDSTSSGPAETCATALNLTGRAVLTGEKSFGKSVQTAVVPLNDHASISLVEFIYCMEDGSSIHDNGLTPEIPVDLTTGQGDDPFYETAVRVLNTL
ncbi:PDZ domain-containing protein [bacterium]|nr:PDZ domain-containing protein [candidate division CSSED10-310 bacterium]